MERRWGWGWGWEREWGSSKVLSRIRQNKASISSIELMNIAAPLPNKSKARHTRTRPWRLENLYRDGDGDVDGDSDGDKKLQRWSAHVDQYFEEASMNSIRVSETCFRMPDRNSFWPDPYNRASPSPPPSPSPSPSPPPSPSPSWPTHNNYSLILLDGQHTQNHRSHESFIRMRYEFRCHEVFNDGEIA